MAAVLQLLTRLNRRRAPPAGTALYIKTSPKHEFVGHTDTIFGVAFLHDNVHIVSGSHDGAVCKWNCETGLLVGEPWEVPVGTVLYSLALSPDGETIACGGWDRNVHRWDTNGQKLEDIWTGHSQRVRALSWSPSGHHLASGSDDGTILIRNAQSGQVEVGPIDANQGWVWSVAYSPSGDRIASGGDGNISIWDSHTGELRVGPIQKFRAKFVFSIVWSLDGSKLYSSGTSVSIFDSASGTELHRIEHDSYLYPVALSPKHNLLVGVGERGFVQLWDTESYQPLGQPFQLRWPSDETFFAVSFSSDGRYLAYGGQDKRITLRIVKDSTSELPVLAANALEEAIPASHSSSNHDVDATDPLAQSAVEDNEALKNSYKNSFFAGMSSHPSLPLPSANLSHKRRWRVILSPRHGQSTKGSRRLTGRLFSRRTLAHSPLRATVHGDLEPEATPRAKSKSKVRNHEEHGDANHSGDVTLGAAERDHDKGKQREQSNPPNTLSSPDELDNRENRILWKSIFYTRNKGRKETPAEALTHDPSPAVVEVYARRVPQGYAALTPPKRKKKSVAGMPSTSTAPLQVGGSPQPGSSSLAGPVAVNPTYDDGDLDWKVEGRWNTFLDKICYPCGH